MTRFPILYLRLVLVRIWFYDRCNELNSSGMARQPLVKVWIYWTIFCRLLELDPELRCELDIIVERLSRAGATLGSFGFCLFSLSEAAP